MITTATIPAPRGEAAVERTTIRIRAPRRGVAVLACRCGRMLDAADMRRPRRTWTGVTSRVEPIVCPSCAESWS